MKPSPEIEAIVRRMIAAREKLDMPVIHAMFTSADDLRLIGTANHEWIRGRDEAMAATDTKWGSLGPHQIELLHIEAYEEGNVGWAATEERIAFPDGQAGVFRHTLVFELEVGAWKLVQSHFSTPVPNLEVWGTDLSESLAGLVESVRSGSELARVDDLSGTATFLFTDLVDSTPLSLSMGEAAWLDAITTHLDTVSEIVVDEGGSVVKTLGDGGMYVFSSGSSALRAAARIQQAVSQQELRVRVGIHSGDVMHTGEDYFGSTVSKAARVASAADGGQILVTSTTAGLVNANEFEFGAPITVELKGLDGTHQLQPLIWS